MTRVIEINTAANPAFIQVNDDSTGSTKAFRYTATGAEGFSFTVNIPAGSTMPNANYAIAYVIASDVPLFLLGFPTAGRAAGSFTVVAQASPDLGTVIEFTLTPLTS